MTQDEIIRFAIQCRLVTTGNRDGLYMDALTEFANLVAAKEREVCGEAAMKAAEKAIDFAIKLEREACAKVCDELHWPWHIGDNSGPKQCAIAIRARGEAMTQEALAQPEQERRGFAGVKIWVGDQQVVKLLTQTELDRAHDTWGFVGHASEMCVATLKKMNT